MSDDELLYLLTHIVGSYTYSSYPLGKIKLLICYIIFKNIHNNNKEHYDAVLYFIFLSFDPRTALTELTFVFIVHILNIFLQ